MPLPTRRHALFGLAALALAGCRARSGKFLVGFSQMDSGGGWRVAETASLREAARARADRFELIVTDAQDQTAKQIADVEDLLARRAGAVFIAPRDHEGIEAALEEARRVRVPVFLLDREAEGTPGVDFVSFIGSDFVSQGRRAARWLAGRLDGPAGIVELRGTPGSSVARDRALGFREGLAGHPGAKIIASQTASFSRSAAQGVAANLFQALGRAVSAVFAHNDEMALGAIQAARAAGRRPGEDVLFVSIDGQRSALEAILEGELGASVESNPRFGPLAFATLERHLAGESVPPRVLVEDRLFDAGNAGRFLDDAY
jgi:ribose transport system substrate-binding protein